MQKTTMQKSPGLKSPRLFGQLVRVSDVKLHDLDAMFAIFQRYYRNVNWDEFRRDFFDKSHVIVFREKVTNTLRGFTTVKTFDTQVEGRDVTALFSGDTVIEREFWGQPALRAAFCRLLLTTWWHTLRSSFGRKPLYWFLISKGYKTYLLLTNNFPRHWPRYDRATPKFEAAVLRQFSEQLYPGRMQVRQFADSRRTNSASANPREVYILPFADGAPCLRDSVAPLREELLEDSNIRFFASVNPGWEKGHELCCLAPVGPAVFFRFVAKNVFNQLGKLVRRLGAIGNNLIRTPRRGVAR